MGEAMASRIVCSVAVACLLVIAMAEDQTSIPDALVAELTEFPSEDTTISRDCFQKSCTQHGCRVSKLDCPKATAPWAVFVEPMSKKKKLVHSNVVKKHLSPGLVDLKMHKKPIDPTWPSPCLACQRRHPRRSRRK